MCWKAIELPLRFLGVIIVVALVVVSFWAMEQFFRNENTHQDQCI